MSEAAVPERVFEIKRILRPLKGRIFVELSKFRYTGRLVIPDNAQRIPTTGIVVRIGEGVTQVQVGDKVVFGLYSGTGLKFKNYPFARVLTEDEILGVQEMSEEELENEAP